MSTSSSEASPAAGQGQLTGRRAAPLCTTCAYPTPHVYTTYTSRSNIRLSVCTQCGAFVDPLIEAPPLLLVLDLVLLKPRVFLHLLYNRGSPPLDARGIVVSPSFAPSKDGYDRSARLWADLLRLGVATLAAEVAVRLITSPTPPTTSTVVLTAGRVAIELSAQLLTSTVCALALLRLRGWYPPPPQTQSPDVKRDTTQQGRDGRRDGFVPVLVPLVLLYTTLLPLVLRLVLRIWSEPSFANRPTHDGPLLAAFAKHVPALAPTVNAVADTWDSIDRVWAGTQLLGGMSAGFGLRVLLPTRPFATVAVVLAGWVAALGVSRVCDVVF